MIVRIVKMTFDPHRVNDFVRAFETKREMIANFEGCAGVELFRSVNDPSIFFTHSRWKDLESLERYRDSELFKTTWTEVKAWFADKPEAWSLQNVE